MAQHETEIGLQFRLQGFQTPKTVSHPFINRNSQDTLLLLFYTS